MSNNLIALIAAEHTGVSIKSYGDGNAMLNNFPIQGIHTEIKPESSGIFVFVFHDFKLLNLDYLIFEKYLHKKLINSKYKMVHFWQSGNCIYIYIKDEKFQNDIFYLEVFNFIENEFKIAVENIEKYLISFLNEN